MRPGALSLAYYPSGRRWCWSRGRVRNAHRGLMPGAGDWSRCWADSTGRNCGSAAKNMTQRHRGHRGSQALVGGNPGEDFIQGFCGKGFLDYSVFAWGAGLAVLEEVVEVGEFGDFEVFVFGGF
jgi:hypothetical protein